MTARNVDPQYIVIPEALADAPTTWSFYWEISLLTAILVNVSVILFTSVWSDRRAKMIQRQVSERQMTAEQVNDHQWSKGDKIALAIHGTAVLDPDANIPRRISLLNIMLAVLLVMIVAVIVGEIQTVREANHQRDQVQQQIKDGYGHIDFGTRTNGFGQTLTIDPVDYLRAPPSEPKVKVTREIAINGERYPDAIIGKARMTEPGISHVAWLELPDTD